MNKKMIGVGDAFCPECGTQIGGAIFEDEDPMWNCWKCEKLVPPGTYPKEEKSQLTVFDDKRNHLTSFDDERNHLTVGIPPTDCNEHIEIHMNDGYLETDQCYRIIDDE